MLRIFADSLFRHSASPFALLCIAVCRVLYLVFPESRASSLIASFWSMRFLYLIAASFIPSYFFRIVVLVASLAGSSCVFLLPLANSVFLFGFRLVSPILMLQEELGYLSFVWSCNRSLVRWQDREAASGAIVPRAIIILVGVMGTVVVSVTLWPMLTAPLSLSVFGSVWRCS